MIHTALRATRRVYPGVVFGCYLLAFVAAFAMVFMLPIGALGLVFISLMALIPVVFGWGILCALERFFAVRKLRSGLCPICASRSVVGGEQAPSGEYSCLDCGGRFSSKGEDIDLPEAVTQ